MDSETIVTGESITTIKPRVVRRFEVELDETGTYTVAGDIWLMFVWRLNDATWMARLSEQAKADK